MISLTINGISYQYPETDDEDWGEQATSAFEALTLLTANLRIPSDPSASAGMIRLGNTDEIAWRDAGDTANVLLFVDSDDKLYYKNGADPAIDLTAAAAGNVTGPGSSTDNAVPRFDSTSGQLLQNSGVIIDDSNNVSGIVNLLMTGDLTADDGDFDALEANSVTIGGVALLSYLSNFFIDVTGSSTDNAVARWNGVDGSLIQNSGVVIDDTDNITGVVGLSAAGLITTSGNISTTGSGDLSVAGEVTISGTGTHSVSEEFANEVFEEYARATGTSVGLRGVAISASSGSFSTSSATFVDVTNLSVTIVGSGRPIKIFVEPAKIIGDSPSILDGGYIAATAAGMFRILRDATEVSGMSIGGEIIPSGAIAFVDVPGAGTFTYKLQATIGSLGSGTVSVETCKLVAYEL